MMTSRRTLIPLKVLKVGKKAFVSHMITIDIVIFRIVTDIQDF